MDNRIVNRAIPIGGSLRSRFVRPDQRGRESQLLLQDRAHLLMGGQTPSLPNRTPPMPVLGVLAIADLNTNPSDDASHGHDPLSPVPRSLVAEGEKPRLGGQLPLGAFVPTVAASTPALRPELPVPSPVMSALHCFPCSSMSFLQN